MHRVTDVFFQTFSIFSMFFPLQVLDVQSWMPWALWGFGALAAMALPSKRLVAHRLAERQALAERLLWAEAERAEAKGKKI